MALMVVVLDDDFDLVIIDRLLVIGRSRTLLRCQLHIPDQVSVHGILHSFLKLILVELFALTMLQAVQIGLDRADHILLLLPNEMSSVGLDSCIVLSLLNSVVILSCLSRSVEATIAHVFILVC